LDHNPRSPATVCPRPAKRQEALELLLDVARDRRLVLLEGAIVLLIVLEIVLTLARIG